MQLPDGTRLVHARHRSSHPRREEHDGACTSDGVLHVHPAFRVIATAEPAIYHSRSDVPTDGAVSSAGAWLSSEILSMFSMHVAPGLSITDHASILEAMPAPTQSSAAAARAGAKRLGADDVAAIRCRLLNLWTILNPNAKPFGNRMPLNDAGLGDLHLTTRGLLRCAKHADGGNAAAVTDAVRRELAGKRGTLSPSASAALDATLRTVGLPQLPDVACANPVHMGSGAQAKAQDNERALLDKDPASGLARLTLGDVRVQGITSPARPELVPSAFIFHDSPAHLHVMQRMLRDWLARNHMLLIGSQGVGKNKITDRMLQLLQACCFLPSSPGQAEASAL
mmetsp:Transcript_2532/g.7143  ORF Transcript_2532/g.7143 Transcript_2532/m.7143 type:complete len:339 (-) Transcript_2532:5581-6597(-)